MAAERPRALVRAVPVWAWLAALVALSFAVRYALARRMPGPWIMVDELIYSELAKSLASTGAFEVRDQAATGYGFVYPLLIAPAYALFSSVPDAYAAVKAINAILVSLAAIPAYLLARRVVSRGLSLVAAVSAVSLPSLVYAGTVMTENAFYPLFLVVALALVATLERPTVARQLWLVALLVLAFETRAQAVALVAAALTAPILLGWASVRAHRLLYAVVLGGGALVALAQVARGRPLSAALGAYGVAGEGGYDLGEAAKWLLYHLAELDLYVAAFPLAATAVLALRLRRLEPRDRAFLAATVALTAWVLLVVATFASRFALRVQERNAFYVVPLLVIALLLWVERGAPRPRAALAAAALAAALPAVLPYRTLIDVPAVSDTLMLLPWWTLQDSLISLDHVAWAATGLCALAALLFLAVPARYALVLPLALIVYFAVALRPIEAGAHGVRQASAGALFSGIANPDPDWIDRAVPRGATVAALRTGAVSIFTVWENEFFNRSVGPVYSLTDANPGGLPETRLRADAAGFLLDPAGRPVAADYLLVDGSVTPAGRVIARDEVKGMLLYRVSGPLRSLTLVTGLYPNDSWSGPRVAYTRLACRGGRLRVGLHSDPGLFRASQTVTASVGGRVVAEVVVPPALPRVLSVPLRARGGRCDVDFAVSPTAVPREVTGGANPDDRELGIHFDSFAYDEP